VVVYETDFESGEAGWTTGGPGNTWQLGTPTTGPGAARSGVNLWATNLHGNYVNNANCWLMSPEIDLTGYEAPVLAFWHWFAIETGYDFGRVEVSTDGTTWAELGRFSHSTAGRVWAQPTFDLSAYAGQTIRVRFRLHTDASVVLPGWYIDDVRIVAMPVTEDAATTAGLQFAQPGEPAVSETQDKKSKPEGPARPEFTWDDVRTGSPEEGTVPPEGTKVQPQALPLDAVVSIEETGRTTRTDPATGFYRLQHVVGTWTLRVYSYGYYPQTESVTLGDGETVIRNFVLEPIPRSTISGRVVDRNTGDPIVGAEVSLVEDPFVLPARTNEAGEFSLECYIGQYTVRVFAPTYYPQNISVTVTEEPLYLEIGLQPFVGYPDELVYDDGTRENAYAFWDPGNGFAVRMTPVASVAVLRGVSFMFWPGWPTPGGTRFMWAIFDSTGPDGSPGAMVAGPFEATALRDGRWTTIDCSHLGLVLSGDFYVAYLQTDSFPNCPGLATDTNGPWYARSWEYVAGTWSQLTQTYGNMMIRASVLNPVQIPVITSPADGTVTNQEEVTVRGVSAPNVEVRLYRDGEEAGRTLTDTNGAFSVVCTLRDGANVFTARAFVGDRYTDVSAPVTVYLDTVPPVLTVTQPDEGLITNRDAVTVAGTVRDDHLDTVTVQGEPVQVIETSFSTRVLLTEEDGPNVIVVVAVDKAGNRSEITRTVVKDTTPPAISEMAPAEDVELVPGDTLTVGFRSEPGLAFAGYQIVLVGASQAQAASFVPMPEDPGDPGWYRATWTVPVDFVVREARVQFRAVDRAGNMSEAYSPGKVTVGQVYTLTVNVTGQGSVTKNPDQAAYGHGTQVTLTAVPATGWTFSHWTGDLTGSANPATITMDGDKAVTAVFTQQQYTLTVNVTGQGSVTKNPDQAAYGHGTQVKLTAVPADGWLFSHWEGHLWGNVNPATLVMDGNKSVTAVFVRVSPPVPPPNGVPVPPGPPLPGPEPPPEEEL